MTGRGLSTERSDDALVAGVAGPEGRGLLGDADSRSGPGGAGGRDGASPAVAEGRSPSPPQPCPRCKGINSDRCEQGWQPCTECEGTGIAPAREQSPEWEQLTLFDIDETGITNYNV